MASGLSGLVFSPRVVAGHAAYGYLAVPTTFSDFPPAGGFPNFLGVAFVELLNAPEVEPVTVAETTSTEATMMGYHVHHAATHASADKKHTPVARRVAKKNTDMLQGRLSILGKFVLIGGV